MRDASKDAIRFLVSNYVILKNFLRAFIDIALCASMHSKLMQFNPSVSSVNFARELGFFVIHFKLPVIFVSTAIVTVKLHIL